MFSPKRGKKTDTSNIACIFVHAGAGFHSVQNEHVHLQACNDAAKTAMACMKNGGSAVDAVELAVKVLEDREITNAGYGSNLAIDGVVECDAVVVDHNGRSGGAGAVAQIKNPISLARLLLDHSGQPLSLRRVPPNFLAGQGATDFAYESGMSIFPLDYLVSPAAKDRWRKWREDLDRAERKRQRDEVERYSILSDPSQTDLTRYHASQDDQEHARRAHANAMRAALNNEAQPISPPPSDMREPLDDSSSPAHSNSSLSLAAINDSMNTTPYSHLEYTDPVGPPGFYMGRTDPHIHRMRQPSTSSPHLVDSHRSSNRSLLEEYPHESEVLASYEQGYAAAQPRGTTSPSSRLSYDDDASDSDSTTVKMQTPRRNHGEIHVDRSSLHDANLFSMPSIPFDGNVTTAKPSALPPLSYVRERPSMRPDPLLKEMGWVEDEDRITDTVGAIAIDLYGNIACAASSGGIGMKHRGRIGPAALVGVGAAVKPEDADDPEHVTVATVTSGTGEHMSTTTAAGVCSERIYHGQRKMPGGRYDECLEEEAMKTFIEKDFMGHPSVVNSHSTGAIGILTVKKTRDGAWLFYGHNTDSFAMASMHSNEIRPVCTMSRNKGNGQIAQGGRSIKNRKRKA